jgi:hypothetical protein
MMHGQTQIKSTLEITFQINNGITLHKSLKLILELPGMGHTIIDIKIIYETKQSIHIYYKNKIVLNCKNMHICYYKCNDVKMITVATQQFCRRKAQ